MRQVGVGGRSEARRLGDVYADRAQHRSQFADHAFNAILDRFGDTFDGLQLRGGNEFGVRRSKRRAGTGSAFGGVGRW
jgi:hypothetical protein